MLNWEYRERQTDYCFRLARLKHDLKEEARAPKQNTETVVCTHPKKFRQGSAAEKIIDEEKIADNKNGATMVCKEKNVGLRSPYRTISLIIPNTIHGCKKRDIGRL